MLKFDMPDQNKGIGAAEGLDRGLLVYKGDELLLEEGMGLGSFALQKDGGTYFASLVKVSKQRTLFEAIYRFDKRLESGIFGIRSKHFTRLQEYMITNHYMKQEARQTRFLELGTSLRKLFKVRTFFDDVPALGEILATYRTCSDEVAVNVSCDLFQSDCTLFIMNELGGKLFDKSIINGQESAAPSGWMQMCGHCELYSSEHALAFQMVETKVPDNAKSRLFWGREDNGNDLCWSGLESEVKFDTCMSDYAYSIKFRKVEL